MEVDLCLFERSHWEAATSLCLIFLCLSRKRFDYLKIFSYKEWVTFTSRAARKLLEAFQPIAHRKSGKKTFPLPFSM